MTSRTQLVDTAKRRGFFFQTVSAHGGASGFYTLGPQGEALRQRITESWRETFVTAHGFDEIRSPTILPEAVFEASGHLDGFDDAMITCQSCASVHRADHLVEDDETVDDAEGMTAEELEDVLEARSVECPTCGTIFKNPTVSPFNLMFETTIGPSNGTTGYLRPETAQGTLAEFWRLREFAREQTPFGAAQVGRAYRNEISPRKSILRTREFSQAELQTFVLDDTPPWERLTVETVTTVPAGEDEQDVTISSFAADVHPWVAYYTGLTANWLTSLGVSEEDIRFRQHTEDELAHYAEDCWDAEVRIHEEWVEVAGLADRGSHDLQAHEDATGRSYKLFDQYDQPRSNEEVSVSVDMGYLGPKYGDSAPDVREAIERTLQASPDALDGDGVTVELDGETITVIEDAVDVSVETVNKTGEHRFPRVIEPAFGLERTLYAVLAATYAEDTVDGDQRQRFTFPSHIAPSPVMVTSTAPDNEQLASIATSLRDELREAGIQAAYEDTGSIGRRYRRHDEIGTPFAITVDDTTTTDGTVTLRERDSREQVRIPLDEATQIIDALRQSDQSYSSLREEYPVVE